MLSFPCGRVRKTEKSGLTMCPQKRGKITMLRAVDVGFGAVKGILNAWEVEYPSA